MAQEHDDERIPRARYQTLRHMETVRNYLTQCITELLNRQILHDQSKLETPEVEAYDQITQALRGSTYGSEAYRETLKQFEPAIRHHYQHNPHHPEYWPDGIRDMSLLDLVEMLCDWKAASLRHDTGDILESIRINQQRFGMSDDLCAVLRNTAIWLNDHPPFHKAHES